MKVFFFLSFITPPVFSVPSRLSYRQLLKNTCQPYKIFYRTVYVTAADVNIKENVTEDSLAEKHFLTS